VQAEPRERAWDVSPRHDLAGTKGVRSLEAPRGFTHEGRLQGPIKHSPQPGKKCGRREREADLEYPSGSNPRELVIAAVERHPVYRAPAPFAGRRKKVGLDRSVSFAAGLSRGGRPRR